MSDLRSAAAAALSATPADRRPSVLVGFDGFIDHIIDVVATRSAADRYVAMPTIAALGSRITAAAGHSTNLELVVKQTKIGGNGPIMANALCSQSARVLAVGLFGEAGSVHPAFKPLADRAERLVNLGPPGVTDALEFTDGKVMLGKIQPLENLTWDNLVARFGGVAGLITAIAGCDAIAATNWTMTLQMTPIWDRLASEVLPKVAPLANGRRRLFFVDLADPAKRPVEDIRQALAALGRLQAHVDVVLGMNGSECQQVCGALGVAHPTAATEWDAAAAACALVRDRAGIAWAMCHLVRSAAVAWSASARPGQTAGQVGADGFFEPKPKITTGAGDHFNAGFLHALLAGIEPAHAILCGGATSGHYVRTGESPTRAQVAAFLRAAAG
jgi:hypothetical protein